MKKIITFIIYITLILSLSACEKNNEITLKSGTYTLQNVERDIPGDFTITIYDDGTFQCFETPISSYIGMGHYSVEKDILTLKEDMESCTGDTNYYQITDNGLLFINDNSANYRFVPLEDKALFTWTSSDNTIEN